MGEGARAQAVADEPVDDRVVRELAEWARAEGLQMTGEGGLLAKLTKRVFEAALEGEMDGHLGYGKHDPAGRDGGNSRNGRRAKTVLTEVGPVEVEVPRDREYWTGWKLGAEQLRNVVERGALGGGG
jgi:putative transposase